MHVDIARAVSERPDVRTTGALGPDDLLVDLLVERLESAGAVRGEPVVLAPAGSSDARAQVDSADMAARLAERWGGTVRLGYAAGPAPTVADSVAAARQASGGAPVAVASYLLAPGFFQQRLEGSGADVVTGAARAGPADHRDRAGPLPGGAGGVAAPSPSPGPAGGRRSLRPRAR